jgi:hypothetical protein
MRNLSPAALAKIANKLGNEPINILEIKWDGTNSWWYADRNVNAAIGVVPGQILEVGNLDNVVDLTHHRSSSEISVKLDDTDGSIKTLMNANDIHLKPTRVWQFFDGMAWEDRFLVFSGVIASPIAWSERERTVGFNVMSKLDDQEVGFSAEVGQFMWLPCSLVGKAWPMAFGTPIDYPALQINHAVKGILGTQVGIISAKGVSAWAANNQAIKIFHPASDYPDTRLAYIQMGFLRACERYYDDAAGFAGIISEAAAEQYAKKAEELAKQQEDIAKQIVNQQSAWRKQADCNEAQLRNSMFQADCQVRAKVSNFNSQTAISEGPDQITIYGGEDFPQDVQLTLNIGGGYFEGSMHGTTFTIGKRWSPAQEAQDAANVENKFKQTCVTVQPSACSGAEDKGPIAYKFSMEVPIISGGGGSEPSGGSLGSIESNPLIGESGPGGGAIIIVLPDEGTAVANAPIEPTWTPSASASSGTEPAVSVVNEEYTVEGYLERLNGEPAHVDGSGAAGDTAQSYEPQFLNLLPGATVTIASDEWMYYVASIVPGTVLSVKAYKAAAGEVRKLVDVPSEYYHIETINYGPVTAVMVVVHKSLSELFQIDETRPPVPRWAPNWTPQPTGAANGNATISSGWEDTLYVTFRSTVGPNIVDVIRYLVNTYSPMTCDAASFDYVRTKMQIFPANFPVLDKKNIISILEEIAYQSRCAIWLKDNVFYIKYLAEEPTVDDIIDESDIDFEKGIEIEYSTTEDITTRMFCKWHLTWAERGEYEFILRHNVSKYGIKDNNYDFYIYNQPDIIYKIATFWLIRNSNTWKRIKFSTFLTKLNIETFDTVLLNFDTSRQYVASGPIKAIVEKANYNSDNHTIDFECVVPVKSGELTQYPFFWPANVPYGTTFPTAREIAEGWAGGNSIGQSAYGQLPIGFVPTQGGTIFIGGMNVLYGPNSDWGDRHPSDQGFSAKSVSSPNEYNGAIVSPTPVTSLSLPSTNPQQVLLSPYSEMKLPAPPLGVPTIYLQKTVIYDSKNSSLTTLDTFFREVSTDGYLIGDTVAYWGDDVHNGEGSKQFDFKFDDEGDTFGAGTAFLKD